MPVHQATSQAKQRGLIMTVRRILYLGLSAMLLVSVTSLPSYAQVREEAILEELVRVPVPHDLSVRELPERSFYSQREDWQAIIDSTWGPGISYDAKLILFNNWADLIHDEFGPFTNWDGNWDTLRAYYTAMMEDSTISHGAFAAVMGHFAHDMREGHTYSSSDVMTSTPLNPGVPLLILGGDITIPHFGAVTTTLADSTLLVLRVVDDHPLELQPGDIMLGYDGVMWKDIVFDMIEARMPIWAAGSACDVTHTFNCLITMGMNWHLFETMDVLQFSTGDTLHLSLEPMLDLNVTHPYMVNNEQLPIPGVEMPDYQIHGNDLATHGIVEGTNTGYIYIWEENSFTNASFNQAVLELADTDGLIIDLRFNMGGWATYETAFDLLFNSSFMTFADAYRCDPNDFSMCPDGSEDLFDITGEINSFYDRPIALLSGHNCVSMGDLTTWYIELHPNTRIFGRPPNGSPNINFSIDGFPGWDIHMAKGDMYLVSDPDSFLTGREVPIDDPVWFTPEEVAFGIDGVVEGALGWIATLGYVHDLQVDSSYYDPDAGSILVTVALENSADHSISVSGEIRDRDSTLTLPLALNDEGSHGDVAPGDGIWSYALDAPEEEDFFTVSVVSEDSTLEWSHSLPDAAHFTTAGPVEYLSMDFIGEPEIYPGDRPRFYLEIENAGSSALIEDVYVRLSLDEGSPAHLVGGTARGYGDLEPGESAVNSVYFWMSVHDTCSYDTSLTLHMDIRSNDYAYWQDEFQIWIEADTTTTSIAEVGNLPLEYALYQNYPNPFNPSTVVKYALPEPSLVTIAVYDINGRQVRVLQDGHQAAGYENLVWNGMDERGRPVGTGLYFCRLQAVAPSTGEQRFSATTKMVYMK